jgi:hypothetical protein
LISGLRQPIAVQAVSSFNIFVGLECVLLSAIEAQVCHQTVTISFPLFPRVAAGVVTKSHLGNRTTNEERLNRQPLQKKANRMSGMIGGMYRTALGVLMRKFKDGRAFPARGFSQTSPM